jgi:hypothetical protein
MQVSNLLLLLCFQQASPADIFANSLDREKLPNKVCSF